MRLSITITFRHFEHKKKTLHETVSILRVFPARPRGKITTTWGASDPSLNCVATELIYPNVNLTRRGGGAAVLARSQRWWQWLCLRWVFGCGCATDGGLRMYISGVVCAPSFVLVFIAFICRAHTHTHTRRSEHMHACVHLHRRRRDENLRHTRTLTHIREKITHTLLPRTLWLQCASGQCRVYVARTTTCNVCVCTIVRTNVQTHGDMRVVYDARCDVVNTCTAKCVQWCKSNKDCVI